MFNVTSDDDNGMGPRAGKLIFPRGVSIQTPHYVAISSRGVIPHLSHDLSAKQNALNAVYVALEDFLEQITGGSPPILSSHEHQTSPIRSFIGQDESQLLVLGARRTPPVTSTAANKDDSVSISTSSGFRYLPIRQYTEIAAQIKPDILIGLGDISFGTEAGIRKLNKMFTRTERWTNQLIAATPHSHENNEAFPAIYAPILPVSLEEQRWYLELLEEDLRNRLSGLAIYDANTLVGLPKALKSLPRLCLTDSFSPQKTLREIALGADLLTLPFINEATDAGIALDFWFPVHQNTCSSTDKLPLGHDMWLSGHGTSLEPLVYGCTCYTCSKHHRAYVQHLLSAKEMLAWVLLQIHNLEVVSSFFAGVRKSITSGEFEQDMAAFEHIYQRELPEKTGKGPRLRGYQYKTEGPGQPKKNESPFRPLEKEKSHTEDVKDSVAELPSPGANANDLEEKGFAVKGE